MYDLRTLGTLDLRGPDGASLAPVLAQPKRAALLAYVALARPHGPVRRDLLLAAFWPELPDDRARAALRNALSFLRKAAPGILAARADDVVEVAADVLTCDVRRMELALASGDVAGALAHYGGDLLAGLHVDAGPAWEHWRDAERVRLRHVALAAARGAAEAARGRGDAAGAVALARRACEIDPDDEPSVRRLMELLAEAGDPAGALREYDRFAARLMRELEVQPAPETEALRRALRVRAEPTLIPPAIRPAPSADLAATNPVSVDAHPAEGRSADAGLPDARSADPHLLPSHPADSPPADSVASDPNPPHPITVAVDAGTVDADRAEGRPVRVSASSPAPADDGRSGADATPRRARRRWVGAVAVTAMVMVAALLFPRMRDAVAAFRGPAPV
ncbi:BTAD domain-containing putative transcriptional regulator, partial [Longimicrobium sp.]|uniref:BTAD domain-containing putative transcriptional regulator n=1 Tax=Longimicrobium sp. TaxID=2029185 RepID=UPI002E353C4E